MSNNRMLQEVANLFELSIDKYGFVFITRSVPSNVGTGVESRELQLEGRERSSSRLLSEGGEGTCSCPSSCISTFSGTATFTSETTHSITTNHFLSTSLTTSISYKSQIPFTHSLIHRYFSKATKHMT